MRLSLICPALLSAILGSACSSPTTDEQRPIVITPEEYCRVTCGKAHTCNDATDVAECRSSCQAELAARPELRPDFLAYVASCVASNACSSKSADTCKSEALAQLAASKYGQAFCGAFVTAGSKCDETGVTYPESSCLEAAKSYDDSALKVANACLAEACGGLNPCLAQAIPDVSLPR